MRTVHVRHESSEGLQAQDKIEFFRRSQGGESFLDVIDRATHILGLVTHVIRYPGEIEEVTYADTRTGTSVSFQVDPHNRDDKKFFPHGSIFCPGEYISVALDPSVPGLCAESILKVRMKSNTAKKLLRKFCVRMQT